MNELSVQLQSNSRNILVRSVPEYSAIWNALRYARPVQPAHREYVVFCDRASAEALLRVARSHCPDSVQTIESALENSRRSRA
jgi:hypothetical protein